jgi:hypothetical protein
MVTLARAIRSMHKKNLLITNLDFPFSLLFIVTCCVGKLSSMQVR